MSDKPLLKKSDFQSDQAIRWCPGCGDYAILAQTQKVFPEITELLVRRCQFPQGFFI